MSKILIVVGPAGAGKSTACKKFATSAPGTWAYVGQDDIRQMIKNGFKNPSTGWDDDTSAQWDVSHHISADIMKRYKTVGINCIVDGFAPQPLASFKNWPNYLRDLEYTIIVLYPKLDTALARNRQRTGDARLADTLIANHHAWYGSFIKESGAMVIDSSNLSLDEVVQDLKNVAGLAGY